MKKKLILNNSYYVNRHIRSSKYFKITSFVLIFLFWISFYFTIASIYDFSMPESFYTENNSNNFLIFNLLLQGFSMLLSIRVLSIGFNNFLAPSYYTLCSFASIVSALQILSVIFSKNPIEYLPFTSISILMLYYANKSLSDYEIIASKSFKVNKNRANIKFITQNESSRSGFICKNELNNDTFFEDYNFINAPTSEIVFCTSLLVYSAILCTYAFSDDIQLFLWSLSAICSVFVPINFFYSNPLKILSRKLEKINVAIKSYSDIKRLHKNKYLTISDKDIFDLNSIHLESIETFFNYSKDEIISYLASAYKHLNLSANQAFEREFLSRNLKLAPVSNVEVLDENGFSFNISNGKFFVGNATLLRFLDITPTYDHHKYDNVVYIASYGKIIAVISLIYKPSKRILRFFKLVQKHSLQLALSTDDFCVTPNLLNELYDIRDKDFILSKKLSSEYNNIKNDKNLMFIANFSGINYISAVLYCKKTLNTMKFNNILGYLICILNIFIVSYLIINFSPHLLLPNNLIYSLYIWYIPSIFMHSFSSDI